MSISLQYFIPLINILLLLFLLQSVCTSLCVKINNYLMSLSTVGITVLPLVFSLSLHPGSTGVANNVRCGGVEKENKTKDSVHKLHAQR
jgi:uncharacterized membrane protein YccC